MTRHGKPDEGKLRRAGKMTGNSRRRSKGSRRETAQTAMQEKAKTGKATTREIAEGTAEGPGTRHEWKRPTQGKPRKKEGSSRGHRKGPRTGRSRTDRPAGEGPASKSHTNRNGEGTANVTRGKEQRQVCRKGRRQGKAYRGNGEGRAKGPGRETARTGKRARQGKPQEGNGKGQGKRRETTKGTAKSQEKNSTGRPAEKSPAGKPTRTETAEDRERQG